MSVRVRVGVRVRIRATTSLQLLQELAVEELVISHELGDLRLYSKQVVSSK